jgi:hypothetical protein
MSRQKPVKNNVRKKEWLVAHIGLNRKILVVNFCKNRGVNFEEYTKKLVDNDVKMRPELYQPHKDMELEIKSQNTMEDKIVVILRHNRGPAKLRHITNRLTWYDKAIDRLILKILVQKTLEHSKFYKTRENGKHFTYGLSEWIGNTTQI